MRHSLVHPSAHLLRYEIREIVDFVQRLTELDPSLKIENENIGDPIAKGWPVPTFMKELIKEEVDKPGDLVFGYTHSRGAIPVRKWIADYSRRFSPNSELDYEDVLITSGLGAAISMMYQMLPKGARILQPSPAYPTHGAFESFSEGEEALTYKLDPEKGWEPDLADMENQIVQHPEVAGILIINPNNPTGAIYSAETLEKIVQLAEKYQLMILSDEIYFRMIYNAYVFPQITEIAKNRVPLIVMRGLSKDVPWPGGRSGWVEFHNVNLDADFKKYADSVKRRALLEVCSTHLPQVVMPRVYDHPEFAGWLKQNNELLERNSRVITEKLSTVKGLKVNPANGAFYMMPIFEDGVLKAHQSLPIANEELRKFVEEKTADPDMALDKRFVYYLVASTGICVVPATGFFSPYYGFRVTTLTRDPQRLDAIYATLAKAIEAYLGS
ncbi:pyridoxal phosphate-dependent aminotransferase [Candidatus Peregrinibacteria bacterium]|nr:MAG: pyridoxal phosphate-dependent aminotransferase [Candidatus Peregrinibacteria bacterium]